MVQIRKEEVLIEAEKKAEAINYVQGLVELSRMEESNGDHFGKEEILKMIKSQEMKEKHDYPDHFLCKILLVLRPQIPSSIHHHEFSLCSGSSP